MTEFTDDQYLNRHRKDVMSQFGEDGIIEKIFQIIPEESQNHWSCEFGAWDGKHCSNTYNLVMNKEWKGIFIEADAKKFVDLCETYKKFDSAVLIDNFVDITGANSLDNILKRTSIPMDFDLLSIDIDSTDYHIWESLDVYRPKLVIIEFNPCIPDNIEFVQDADPNKHHGTSILSMTNLAKRKNYELVCVNAENAFYVDKVFFPLFDIEDNSIRALKYYREPLQVFQLFDGTLVFHGHTQHRLVWYSLPVNFNKLQILPRFVRNSGAPWGGGWLGLIVRAIIKGLRKYRQRFWNIEDTDPGAWKM